MNTKVKKRGSIQTLTTFWTTALMMMVLAVAPCALASTAENTEITNTVTVTWNDVTGLNSYNTDATSTVTVDLVPSQPNIVYAPAVDSTENTIVDLTYTITGTANGDDSYTIALTNPANVTVGGLTLPAADTTIILGGTTLVADTDGTFTITVPFDGDATGNSVNSIAPNSWIVIGTTAYEVSTITENAAANTTTIELFTVDAGGGALAPPSGAAGDVVGEQQTVTISVTTGAFPPADTTSTTGTHDVDATVSWTGGSVVQASDTVITVHRPLLTVNKYVQVVAGGSVVTGSGGQYGPIDVGSGSLTYYQNVDAPPGATLEYIVVVENTGTGTDGQASNLVIEDPIPQFTTYVANSLRLYQDIDDTATYPLASPTDASGDDAGETDGTPDPATIWIYAGINGTSGTGGTLAAGATTIGAFQVTID
jgi:uncharacterized repeat protein (TIGR01451 family)